MPSLAQELINSLAELDTRLAGLGLYSTIDYQAEPGKTHPYWKTEWDLALLPRLKELDCKIIQPPVFGTRKYRAGIVQPLYNSVRFRAPTGPICDLRLIRTSKIKVRRYGSGYQVDRTVDFETRWGQLKMDRQIRQLWWPDHDRADADLRMVLFVGFDKALRPFRPEMTALEKTATWNTHHIAHKSKSWPDPYGRDFNVLVACWTSIENKI